MNYEADAFEDSYDTFATEGDHTVETTAASCRRSARGRRLMSAAQRRVRQIGGLRTNARQRRSALALALSTGLVLPAVVLGSATVASAAPVVNQCLQPGGATTALASLCVQSSAFGSTTAPYVTTIKQGDRVNEFKWLVNLDNTGDPAANANNAAACMPGRAQATPLQIRGNRSLALYAKAGTLNLDGCVWPSMHAVQGNSPVVASGDQTQIGSLRNLPTGRYLVSVTSPGFKIDGVHFEVRAGAVYSVNDEVGKPFVVSMNPLPKKTTTLRVHVYNDNASTNSQWDGQTETLITCDNATREQRIAHCGGARVNDPNIIADPSTDMAGFTIQISDVLNPVTTDVYGNPLCTEYVTDANGNTVLDGDGAPIPLVFANGGASGSLMVGTESSCVSDHYGDIVIPNLGPNRYAATVIPPDPRTHGGDQWIQTTTLEGGHDWDMWQQEGETGYDTELLVGGERVTPVAHGFVKLTHNDQVWKDAEAAAAAGNTTLETAYYNAAAGFDPTSVPGTGVLKGRIREGHAFIASGGGAEMAGTNLANSKDFGPITDGIVSVACIATCSSPTDQVVWTGRARAADGSFEVGGLQTGDYAIALWDETQSFILATVQYHVVDGQITDMGDNLLYGWFTMVGGNVFIDTNGNGVRDAGEQGVPGFGLTIRTRGNSQQDQGASAATTNEAGEFDLSQAYPLNQFLILEAYNPRYKNTGYTYQADVDPNPHTVLSSQVDFNFLPVFGNSVNFDIGVQPYGTGSDYWSGTGAAPADENGGIVGTVTYDVTRNELDPAYSAQEAYQPGVPGIPMQLWKTQKSDGVHPDTYPGTGALKQFGIQADGTQCMRPDTARGSNAVTDSTQTCKPYDYYVTENWTRPTGCVALDINGNHLQGEMVLPDAPAVFDDSHSDPNNPDCIEAPMNGVQVGGDGTVDGNYALTSLIKASTLASAIATGANLEQVYADSQNNPANADPLTSGDYIVEAVNPIDTVNNFVTDDPGVGGYTLGGTQNRLYKFTHEDSINVFTGDTYVPQGGFVTDGSAAGTGASLNTTNRSHVRKDNNTLSAGQVAQCAGSMHVVTPNNGDLVAAGGSPYVGENTPICDSKLVTVVPGRSVNPTFYMYTDVPIPTRFFGLIIDDLNVETSRRGTYLGEMAPVPNAPITIFDENGNWKFTSHSDPNGNYEVLLPSMDTYNCPLPAGPCPNLYRLVGNDPGSLAHRNTDYNPQYKVISTTFQGWAGVVHPVDQAPTHNGITIEPTGVNGPTGLTGPSSVSAFSLCQLANNQPQIYTIDKPFYDPAADGAHLYTIKGIGFGVAPQLTLTNNGGNAGGQRINLRSQSDTQLTFVLPNNLNPGPYRISIRNAGSGLTTVNGLIFHRLSPLGAGGRTANATYLTRNDVYEVTPSIIRDNAGQRQFTPMMDAWDALTDTPAGFNGVSKYGDVVNGGRAIQRAVEAAYQAEYVGSGNTRADNRPKMVVVYPNTADNYAPHNAFGAYYENLLLHGKVRLQGVGPGSDLNSTSPVIGTAIDSSQFWSSIQVMPPTADPQATDGSYSVDWRTWVDSVDNIMKVAGSPEGSAILAIAEKVGQWNSTTGLFKPGIDGFLLTGGDAQGTLNNGNIVPGAAEPAGVVMAGSAQGGAVTLDTYVTDFQVTNNLIEGNNGAYGVVRVGTPDITLFVPETGTVGDHPNFTGSMHNERFNFSNNRIIANSGTNRAGALGLYNGADNYLVSNNDFCGNFSAEYGGAITHYGQSGGGVIRHNRIYYNQAYGEGGGIMIAGELPANNNMLSDGAGRGASSSAAVSGVLIDQNTITSNQANDDGGGVRFLMAGNFPFVLQNNMIAGNVSTHMGGGVALDDAPNVTLVNNTIAKNITTATAITNSAGPDGIQPAHAAGLATGGNSSLLQATLLPSAPNWSKPTLINNVFADNRAAWAEMPSAANFNTSAIKGIGQPGDTSPIQRWDIGVSGAAGLNNGLDNTNTVIPFGFDGLNNTTNTVASIGLAHTVADAVSYVPATGVDNIDPVLDGAQASVSGGVGFINEQEQQVDSMTWRRNTAVQYPVLMSQLMPATLMADYHLAGDASRDLAVNKGTTPNANRLVPTYDIDGQQRPLTGLPDRGADEITGVVTTELTITKTDGVTSVHRGDTVNYTIVVTNAGPDNATNARVQDTPPATIGNVTWTCADGLLSFCPAASGSGPLNQLVNILNNDSLTFTLTGTVLSTARNGSAIRNSATVTRQTGAAEAVLADNTAIDTDTVAASTVDVSITKTDNQSVVHPGAITTYTIVVANAGPNIATGVTVTDTPPATLQGVTWTCAASAGAICGAASGARAINQQVTLPAGGQVTYTVVASVAPNATRSITNTARVAVAAGDIDTNAANNSATDTDTVLAQVNLRVTKTDGSTTATRNRQVTYTITVTNTGPDPAINASVIDAAPGQLRNVRWTCVSALGATCGAGGGNAGTPNGSAAGVGSINRIVNVPVGGTITFTVIGTVVNTTPVASTISNTVTAVPAIGVQQLTVGINLANDTDTVI